MAEEKDLIKDIEKVLDETIRPAMQNDGGDVSVIDYDPESGTLFVQLEGACSGCPMSRMTLKGGVERILVEKFEEIKVVEAI
jgi:NFU1 iron-sulfur cluster scaffold homolog, mitochondrial